jgi:phenylalanyl-tRNA synthetase beta chain
MNASYEWLKAFVPFELTPAQLRDLITMRCATVDSLTPLREDLASIVVARVVEAKRHPDSDHLWVTRVDAGQRELLDVVCGAPNVEQGRLYPFAASGTTMPNGLKIEKRKIRGQTSNGMLCSARELGLGVDHDGIMTLELDVAPGTPFLRAVPAGDTRIEIDVLPNRPDLLSHAGVAREIGAALGLPVRLPELPVAETATSAAAASSGSALPAPT